MSEPIFNSDLTMEQIEKNFEGMDFFAGLMEGLQEAYACEKGNAAPGHDLTQAIAAECRCCRRSRRAAYDAKGVR